MPAMSRDTYISTGPQLGDPELTASVLEAHGVAITPQRLRIAQLMLARSQHLTAEQVMVGLRLIGARVSKATVYNTLNLFAERGLLRRIDIDATRTSFDSNTDPHYHFHNVETGELIDVGIPDVEFQRLPELPAGTELADVDIVLRIRAKRSPALPG